MPGGLLQLIAVGQIDQYLTIKPDFSFYQHVYKKHTNFALESRILTFQKNPKLINTNNQVHECIISRYGDLLNELYFVFTLPDIYSNENYMFKWVKNIGNVFIKKASVYIDGNMIDQTTGEWMTIWNELSLPAGDTKYDTMVGNVEEMFEPKLSYSRVSIKNNKFKYHYYPISEKNRGDPPSIKSRKIIVPLNFWFCKNPSLALPLLRLQFNIVSIKIELESSECLYQVFSNKINRYISPIYYNELHNENINIKTFTDIVDIEPYIDANYVFLAEEERNILFMKPKLTYLVEQLTINSIKNISSVNSSSENINIIVNNPTKELIWVIKRDDYLKYNDHFNYSPDIPESSNKILEKAVIRFNSNNRFEEKSGEYFNMIQPYQYHSRLPKKGIYCYSFALYPEKNFLSGYYNAALVRTNISLNLNNTYNNDIINNELIKINKSSYEFNYLILIYAKTYNFFEIIGSQSGMKFTLNS